MDSILQRFLDAGMLDIDNDDAQYDYLSETAQELAETLSENIREVIPFTLVALDPDCAPNDPVFDRIEETLKARWKLLRRRYTDRPRQIYRAIAFESLNLAGDKHEKVFPLAWLTGSSYLPYARLTSELEICQEFFRSLGDLFDTNYHDLQGSTNLPILHVHHDAPPDTPKPRKSRSRNANSDTKSKEELLEEQWAASISNQPYKGKNLVNPNPQGYRQGYFPEQAWTQEFAPRATQLLTDFYNSRADELREEIDQFLGEIVQHLQAAINLKSDVLWWRQTLYSSSQRRSYREMEPDMAAIVMAIDLQKQVPPVYPVSTDYILYEAITEMLSWHERSPRYGISLQDYLGALDSENCREMLQSLLHAEGVGNGRNSLLALTQAHLYGRPVVKESIRQRLGLAADVEIPLSHLAVWLFRDLQAQKLIQADEHGTE